MVSESLAGNFENARKSHYDLLPITKMFFEEGNPGGVKVSLKVLGIMEENMRLPLYPVSESLRTRITTETNKIIK
jgi:4-hydroxy-tetrahydrodipicolinate synthase